MTKSVFKGMLAMVKALTAGLENTYSNHGLGGMASTFMVLEIIHTHYWEKESMGSSKSDTSNQSMVCTLYQHLFFYMYYGTLQQDHIFMYMVSIQTFQ